MSVRNVFASHSGIAGDRSEDFAARLLLTGFTGMAPMTALSAGMPNDRVTNTSFSWVEDDQVVTNALTTATATAIATTVVVDDSNIWTPGSILLNHNTGEQLYVTAIAGNSLTVTRAFAGTTGTAIAIGHRLQQVGTAFPEGSRGAASVMQQGVNRTGYVQIFKSNWSITGTAAAVSFQSGGKEAQTRQQAMDRIYQQLEEAAIFGRPSVTRVNGPDGIQEMRTTTGLDYAIRTYGGLVTIPAAQSVAGRLNLTIFNNFMRQIFDRNIKGQPNERMTFCGSSFVALIQQMIMDLKGYQFEVGAETYGIRVMKVITPNGQLSLVTHPLYVGNPAMQNELMVWHPGGVRRRTLREIQVTPRSIGNQANALDANSGDILLEMGYEIKGTSVMGILSGTSSAGGLAALPTT